MHFVQTNRDTTVDCAYADAILEIIVQPWSQDLHLPLTLLGRGRQKNFGNEVGENTHPGEAKEAAMPNYMRHDNMSYESESKTSGSLTCIHLLL